MQLALNLRSGLRFCVLGSGSSGNAVVVEYEGRRLLIDCGFSARELVRRLESVGIAPETIGNILITHEHNDHCRGVRQFRKRFQTPVWATEGTLQAMRAGAWGSRVEADQPQELSGMEVTPFAIPHDAREPVGYVLEASSGERLAVIADLGEASGYVWRKVDSVDALVLESNHDVQMLTEGPYPWPLKRRILSHKGHLSNQSAAEGLRQVDCDRLQMVVLYHLSRTNNRPHLAAEAMEETLENLGSAVEVVVSNQTAPTDWIEIGSAR